MINCWGPCTECGGGGSGKIRKRERFNDAEQRALMWKRKYGRGVVKASRRSELIVCGVGSEEVQLVRTINDIKELETYLASLVVDQSRMR